MSRCSYSERERLKLLSLPYGFAMGVLGLDLYPWQVEIMAALDRPGSVAVKAANGSGKTTGLGAPLALWHASVYPGSLTIVTAGVYRQVRDAFFPAIRSFAPKLPGSWTWNNAEVTTHTGSRIIGFSTDDAQRFEGWHNENLLIIIDEAKSVPDEIFNAVERCQPSRLLLISSPGPASGAFYRAFTKDARFYRRFSVTAYDCPHIERSWIAAQIEKHGADSPLVRSMIHADFDETADERASISLRAVEDCIANPPVFADGEIQAFCDFAAGGDENVLAIRRGNRVEIADAWRDSNTMQAVGRFIRLFERHQLPKDRIFGDGSGLGRPICDRMAELGWPITGINNGAKPKNRRLYANLGIEMWAAGARMIEKREVILPNDEALIGQLTTRRVSLGSTGVVVLETKEQMRRRGCQSPDRADAVFGALYPLRRPSLLV